MIDQIYLREWQTVGPVDDRRLARSVSFTRAETELIAELAESRRIEVLEVRDGLRITTYGYVGAVRLGPLTLHIRPGLAELSPLAMATLLRYALGMGTLSIWDVDTEVSIEQQGFADLVARALLEEVSALLRAGLLQDYETHCGWRSSPRGRLDLMEAARRPARAGTEMSIPCRTSDRVTDVVLNRLVSAALDAARPLVRDRRLAFDLHSRFAHLSELCRKEPLTRALFEQAAAAIGPRSGHYQPVLRIAELLLEGFGGSVGSAERSAPLQSFLLDMNLLFERFVCRLLSDFGPPGLRVETQVSQSSAYRWSENPHGWQRPRLRPDIVVYDRATGRPRLILDAKYKPLGPDRRPSPEDLYQLTLYSISFGQKAPVPARIVFPETADRLGGPASSIQFRGAPRSRPIASVGFYGLPLLPVTTALRHNDEQYLRQVVAALVA